MKKIFLFILFCVIISPLYAQKNIQKIDSVNRVFLEQQQVFQKLLDSSNVFYNEGDFTKSLDLNMQILQKATTINNPYFIHQAYRYLAYDYLVLNDTILAMKNFEKSEKYAKLSKNDTATAVTYMDLANIYATKENYSEAYIYHDKSIQLFNKIKDSAGLAKAHYNTIITAASDEDYEKAYSHILKAKELIKYSDHISFSIALDNYLGEYYYYTEDYSSANQYFLKVIEDAKKENLTLELENAYYLYSQSLFAQNKYKEAYEVFEIYDEYSDENSMIYTSSERYSLTEKYQLSEFRKDIDAAKLRNQLQAEIVNNKNRLNIILIIVATSFLFLLIALYSASLKRRKLVKELKIKNREAILAREESEKLSKAKNKFFSTVSHELRTPLYGVIGLSTILMEDKSLIKHEKDIKSLKFSADYLLALINDVLQINKIDSDNMENVLTSFNLKELIEPIVSSFEYMRIQNDNKVHLEISKNIPGLIQGNAVRLSQILMNLIGNACKFTENGDISIIAETTNNTDSETTINFIIKDTGIGIAKEKQESIFEEFNQIDSLNYNYQGTGLGLPIVKKLLKLSNSSINLESELGKGSSFSFSLTYNILEKAAKTIDPITIDAKILENKKILIVEDNRINQIVTKKILEKNNIICTIAENGEQAIQKVKIDNFDLILMDINMPVKNGIDASKEIRKFNKTIPIIALTAVEIEEMRHNIYLSGMNDIIVKPYDVTKFIHTIIKNISIKENQNLGNNSRAQAM